MSAPFDSVLKQLLDKFGPDWVAWLRPALALPPEVRATPFRAELSTVQLLADRVFRLHPPELGLLHVEPQSSWDGDLLQRLHEYNVLLHRHAETVYTVLLLLRREANRPIYTGRHQRTYTNGIRYHAFLYFPIRLWELPADEILAGDIGTLPLALLSDDAAPRLSEVADRIAARLDAERVREETRLLILTSGLLLGGLRYNPDEMQQAFVRARGMRESSTYQMILREGRQEGRQEGLLESKREDLMAVLRERFGSVSPELEQRINTVTDVAALSTALRAAVKIAHSDDLPL